MGVNGIFCIMMLLGLLYAAATGRADAAQRALLSGGGEAVALLLNLAGAYAFFGGLLGILRACGAADALARAMEKPLSRLFRFAPGEEEALSDISLNLSANMLGLAARRRQGRHIGDEDHGARQSGRRASNAMILFLVVNTSSVQLLPTTMIALRAQAGAANPADIVLAHAAGDGGFNRVRRGNLPSSGGVERMSALFLPALCIAVILAGLLARTNVYDAFVRGAEEGLATLIQIAPCLCAILSATGALARNGAADCVDGRTETCVCGAASAGRGGFRRAASSAFRFGGAGGGERRNLPMRRGQPGGAAGVRHQRGERDRVFYRVALSGRGGRQTCASCRSRDAAGLCGGGAGGGAAGLKQEVKRG